MIETLKKNIKNKSWWIAVISALILICQSYGIDITKYIGNDWQSSLNTIFGLVVLFGISVDTTNRVNMESVIKDSKEDKIIENKTESTTTSINNDITENSASAKTIVVNPSNIQSIGQVVNSKSASNPV